MATKWKITSVYDDNRVPCSKKGSVRAWTDTEEPELEKLAKGATAVARESMKHINVEKARACRRKMIQELLSAK